MARATDSGETWRPRGELGYVPNKAGRGLWGLKGLNGSEPKDGVHNYPKPHYRFTWTARPSVKEPDVADVASPGHPPRCGLFSVVDASFVSVLQMTSRDVFVADPGRDPSVHRGVAHSCRG
ncbi:hypothetical protein J6590_017761 [Homalodisca vitripennis]|nr:hypothetical protein J6590_017761 [Homalodisca vitripennis]